LLERDRALAAVTSCLDRACAGVGGSLFLVGEAGLGKTSVLESALGRRPDGMDIAFGRGEPMEASLAFGLARQVFGADNDALLELGEATVEPSVPYDRLLRRLQAPRERPLLLAVDDLHWSDGDSLGLLAFLARRLKPLRVALIGTLRPWPAAALEACRALASAGDAALDHLEPLGRASVEALLVGRCGAPVTDDAVERAYGLAGGNPLLTEQLALALARGDQVPRSGATVALGERVLLARFAGLDPAGLEVARGASVFGASFRPDLVLEVVGLEQAGGDRALEALCATGLVFEERTGVLRFSHPLFAQALYDDLPAPVRLRLHARAFAGLVDRGLEAQAAEHATRAELAGDARAVELLVRVGLAALASGAVDAATRNLEAAVRLNGERVNVDASLAFARALSASGRMEEAAVVARGLESVAELGWRERIEVLRMLGRALYLTGAADHGGRALERAVAIALEHDPTAAVDPLLDRSLSAWLAAGPAAALPLAERARDLAAGGDTDLRERALATWGHMALESGDREGWAATEPLARYLGPAAGGVWPAPAELIWPWAPIYQFAMNANYVERNADAERVFKRAREVVERAGAANALATLAIYVANTVIRLGRPADALSEAIRAQEFAELTPGVLPYAQLMRAEALLWLGRLDESERFCALVEPHATAQWFVRLWLAHVRGLRHLWDRDGRASDELLIAEQVTRWAGIREPCHLLWAGHAVAAHLAVGREGDARRVLEWIDACAARLPCVWPRIAAAVGRAQLSEYVGDDVEADRGYALALALHEQVEMPLQRVEASLAYGGFLRRRGRRSEARPRLASALELAERCGAEWLAHSAAQELGLAGGRRRRPASERDRLTVAESRVAQLAAEGHSNAEIARRLYLSVNTVQTHLKHVFSKLGISSRHQLRDLERDL
jgi:DNA-binding CsgD family transcriptional regulator